jgi:colanic acid/amylovoran biosynthesis protein
MKKILIVPSNTDLNRGDQALTWESISIAEEVFKDDVQVFLYKTKGKLAEKKQTNHQTEKMGYPFFTKILSHPRRNDVDKEVGLSYLIKMKWGVRAIFDIFIISCLTSKSKVINKFGALFLNADRKTSYENFKDLDGLFVKGGGFLHSYGSIVDPYVMYFNLFDVFLAKRFNIPVFILPNSIGPLKNKFAKKIVLSALNYANIVYVREGTSQAFLKEQGVEAIKSPDLGFYLKPSDQDFKKYLQDAGIPIGVKKCVAITLRPYRFDGKPNADELYYNYVTEIETLIVNLLNDDVNVTLVAHTIGPSAHEDDTIPLLEIFNSLKDHENLVYLDDKYLDCRDLENIYSHFDLVIGTRFHSVIFALNVETPSIAIAYGGNKAVGIMNDMGLQEFVVPIENPNSELLLKLSNSILIDSAKYIEKIKEYKIQLNNERNLVIDKIKSSFNEKSGIYK